MNEVFLGLPGVLCYIDDILIHGNATTEHESRLQATLERIQSAGITLNEGKCQFYQSHVTFIGHVIDENWLSPDPKKRAAIQEMSQPSSITELQRFMWMVNQMSKFSPNIAHLSKPFRDLLSSKTVWTWSVVQNDVFLKLKEEISLPRVLVLYDAEATT